METKQLFKIFDSCEPTVAQVKRYLGLISGAARSEFDLVFVKNGNRFITRKLRKDLGELEGIVIEGKIFFAKGLAFDDLNKDLITNVDLLEAAKTFHPKAKPLGRDEFYLLANRAEALIKMEESLEYLGYLVDLPQRLLLVSRSSSSHYAETVPFGTFGGCRDVDITTYLREGGKILLYTDVE